jgi:lipopolysaccharide/colanic/teichoic acid biosynthesis glycosyltransferase
MLVKFADIQRIFSDQLPENFDTFKTRSQLNSLKFNSFRIAGETFDLEKEDHLIKFISQRMKTKLSLTRFFNISCGRNCDIAGNARFLGPVKLGSNVRIEQDAVLVGPVIISDNVTVGNSAVVKSSALAPGLDIPPGCIIENRVLSGRANLDQNNQMRSTYVKDNSQNNFRKWSRFSLVNILKRFADLFVSTTVLVFFAPLFPIIALIIKLTSKGPVFFKHKRQGLHGREFNCLKFRTMITGADEIQAKLRSHNQVDGPQFMVEDDPRITVVGKFLRNTFIDEIPQFINVLLGQMSLVGPRPSPKSENSLCPPWRDARLSVKPGISGLWQVSRTRQPGKDFQEWIYYDTCYVRNLSLKMDLKIGFKTAKKIAVDFVKQF